MTQEKRTERINMKILPSLKEAAEKAAKAEGRTLSNYIEQLIIADIEKKGWSKNVISRAFIKSF